MSEHASRPSAAPAQQGTGKQSVEVLPVQPLEDLFQIARRPLWRREKLAAADLANELQLLPHLAPVQVQAITMRVDASRRAAIQFAEQYVSERFDNRGWRALENVRDPDGEPPALEPDRAVCIGIAPELNYDLRKRRARFELFEHARVDFRRRLEKQRALRTLRAGQVVRIAARLHSRRI